MLIIDHRTGKHVHTGDTVEFAPGEGYKLLDVTDAGAWACAKIQRLGSDTIELVTLDVRFDHPFHRWQRVGVIPDITLAGAGGDSSPA